MHVDCKVSDLTLNGHLKVVFSAVPGDPTVPTIQGVVLRLPVDSLAPIVQRAIRKFCMKQFPQASGGDIELPT